jgi:hypothetical protein
MEDMIAHLLFPSLPIATRERERFQTESVIGMQNDIRLIRPIRLFFSRWSDRSRARKGVAGTGGRRANTEFHFAPKLPAP